MHGLSARVGLVVAALVAALAAACPPAPDVPRDPHQVTVRLRFKASCGSFTATSYDTTCLSALRVAAIDPSETVLGEACQRFGADGGFTPANLGEVIFSDAVGVALAGVSADDRVSVRVLGVQAADSDPCTTTERNEALFWGRSKEVLLGEVGADGGARVVDVAVECRDCVQGCDAGVCHGCMAIAEGNCPVDRPADFCIPDDGVCFRPCAQDRDCFEGLMRCNTTTHRCEPFTEGEQLGGLCTPCESVDGGPAEGCLSPYICVGTSPTSRRGFCAAPCEDFSPCARGAKCNALGHNLFVVGDAASDGGTSSESVDAGVDAGVVDAG